MQIKLSRKLFSWVVISISSSSRGKNKSCEHFIFGGLLNMSQAFSSDLVPAAEVIEVDKIRGGVGGGVRCCVSSGLHQGRIHVFALFFFLSQ